VTRRRSLHHDGTVRIVVTTAGGDGRVCPDNVRSRKADQ